LLLQQSRIYFTCHLTHRGEKCAHPPGALGRRTMHSTRGGQVQDVTQRSLYNGAGTCSSLPRQNCQSYEKTKIWIPSNTRFLEPTRVYTRHRHAISSAVFAQFTCTLNTDRHAKLTCEICSRRRHLCTACVRCGPINCIILKAAPEI